MNKTEMVEPIKVKVNITHEDVGREYIGRDGCIYEIVNYVPDREFPFTSLKVGTDSDCCGLKGDGHAVLTNHKFLRWHDPKSIITSSDIGRRFKTKTGWVYKVRDFNNEARYHAIVEDVFDKGCYGVTADGRFDGGDRSVAFLNWLAVDEIVRDEREDSNVEDGLLICRDFDYHRSRRSDKLMNINVHPNFKKLSDAIDIGTLTPLDVKPKEECDELILIEDNYLVTVKITSDGQTITKRRWFKDLEDSIGFVRGLSISDIALVVRFAGCDIKLIGDSVTIKKVLKLMDVLLGEVEITVSKKR